jgi:hypothetical protein
MPEEVEYESGAFHAYRATETINIGAIDTQTSGYNVKKDEVFRYDGDTIILKDGREFPGITQLRGAIKAGWFVNASDTESIYRPKSANIQIGETEQRGRDKAPKHRVIVQEAEDAVAGSVSARKADREAKHEAISRGTPVMESAEARAVVASQAQAMADEDLFAALDAGAEEQPEVLTHLQEMVGLNFDAQILFKSGDREMDLLAGEISEAGDEWIKEKIWAHTPDEVEDGDPTENVRAKIETDMLGMFSLLDDMEEPSPPKRRKAAPKAAPKAAVKANQGAQPRFPVQQEERIIMPIKRADDDNQGGEVVGKVAGRSKVIVESEVTIPMNVAPAVPKKAAPEPTSRFGAAGAIVVDDQRNVGKIALSDTATRTNLDVSAKVVQSVSDGVRMDDSATVGGRKKHAVVSGESDGVVVGKILSPTHTEFNASQVASTSAAQIDNIAKGKTLKVEKVDHEPLRPETTKTASAVATGDVQEVQAGEELTDLLPDAATPPAPEAKVYVHQDIDPAYAAIKMLIPDFKWNKERRWQDRVEDAMKFVKKPQYMKGILAVETEIVRDKIKERLAEVLQGSSKAN